jgi:hypothetical protein
MQNGDIAGIVIVIEYSQLCKIRIAAYQRIRFNNKLFPHLGCQGKYISALYGIHIQLPLPLEVLPGNHALYLISRRVPLRMGFAKLPDDRFQFLVRQNRSVASGYFGIYLI